MLLSFPFSYVLKKKKPTNSEIEIKISYFERKKLVNKQYAYRNSLD